MTITYFFYTTKESLKHSQYELLLSGHSAVFSPHLNLLGPSAGVSLSRKASPKSGAWSFHACILPAGSPNSVAANADWAATPSICSLSALLVISRVLFTNSHTDVLTRYSVLVVPKNGQKVQTVNYKRPSTTQATNCNRSKALSQVIQVILHKK